MIPKLVYLAITAGMKTIEEFVHLGHHLPFYHVVLMIELIPVERTKFSTIHIRSAHSKSTSYR